MNMAEANERRRFKGRRSLSEADAKAIRRRVANGERQSDLAREYGVSTSTIWLRVHRQHY